MMLKQIKVLLTDLLCFAAIYFLVAVVWTFTTTGI
jgi:hypothetical protein